MRDKLFFFFAYEGLRNRTNDAFEAFIDTPQFRDLIRTARPNSLAATVVSQSGVEPRVISLLNRSCSDFNFPAPTPGGVPKCQQVPGGFDLGSPALSLGQYVPLSADFGLGGGFDGIPDVAFALLENPRSTDGNQYVTRVDFNATEKDRFAFTLFYTPADLFGSDRAAQSRPMADIHSNRLNWNTAFTYIRTFGPTVINEFRFNITKWGFDEVDSNPEVNFGIPRIEIESFLPTDRLRYGANRSENTPGVIGERQIDIRDTLTWIRGNHGLKFGGEYRIDNNNNTGTGGARPLYSFVRWNFFNDTPIFEAINADAEGNPQANNAPFRSGDLAFFFQDDWKARPNLTLNLGLRWEYFEPIKADQLGNLMLGPNGLTDARIVTDDKLYDSDFDNFGPQLGFAWSPERFNNKLVLRGGFGVGYDRLANAILANTRANPPNGQRYGLCCGTAVGEFGSPFVGGQIVYALGSSNDPTSFPRHPGIGGGVNPDTGGPNLGRIEVWGVQRNLRTSHILRYSLDAQYELPWQLVGTLGYQGSRSRQFTRIEPLHLTQPGIAA
ncbi:MAG TPA: TonB-dependent receptor, partial [Pyrinomonadaceae bacterium]